MVDDLEKLLETKNNKKQKSGSDIKKDINWIKSTRLKLEELVEQIKNQLSDPTDVPIVYTYEDGFESSEDLDDEGTCYLYFLPEISSLNYVVICKLIRLVTPDPDLRITRNYPLFY